MQQRRPSKKNDVVHTGPKTASFSYHVIIGATRREVCFKAFISVYSVSEKRIRRIRHLKLVGKTPEDKRGKSISNTLSPEAHHAVHEHIKSFPLKQSHYCGKKKYYLSADLTLKKMWKLFKEGHAQFKISQTTYWRIFRENFNYTFGRPQVDACCLCEELGVKIKSPHLNEVAKRTAVAELLVHRRKAKKFYSALQHEKSQDGQKETHVLSLAFDYMKTVSLPKVPVQELYYLRQLSVNIFGIHHIKDNKTTIFLYHEGIAKKGPNEVCSFINEYLKSIPDHYTELRLFCDNCGGQNKNQALSRFCLYLTDSGRFNKVVQYFPLRGHSFLPCDRDFGLISKTLRNHDRIFTVHEITEHIINSSSKDGKFTVHEVTADEVLDFKKWQSLYYKKSCISKETRGKNVRKEDKVNFQISTLFQFEYMSSLKGYVKAYKNINGLICHNFFMSKSNAPVSPPTQLACPTGKCPIKKCKVDDLKRLRAYIPDEFKDFYEEICSWPTTDADGPDSDMEVEDDGQEND